MNGGHNSWSHTVSKDHVQLGTEPGCSPSTAASGRPPPPPPRPPAPRSLRSACLKQRPPGRLHLASSPPFPCSGLCLPLWHVPRLHTQHRPDVGTRKAASALVSGRREKKQVRLRASVLAPDPWPVLLRLPRPEADSGARAAPTRSRQAERRCRPTGPLAGPRRSLPQPLPVGRPRGPHVAPSPPPGAALVLPSPVAPQRSPSRSSRPPPGLPHCSPGHTQEPVWGACRSAPRLLTALLPSLLRGPDVLSRLCSSGVTAPSGNCGQR